MPSVRGRRPTATSSSSPSRVVPSARSTRTRPSSRVTRVTFASQQISTPWAASPSWTAAEANGSSRGRMRCPPSRSATSLPRVAQAWASSTPTGPAPRTSRRPGASFDVVAARFVHGRASASPSMGGRSASEPVASTTARSATSRSSPTRTRRSPSRAACPRTIVIPRSASHGTMTSSSRSWTTSSRRASAAAASSSPVTASAAPGTRCVSSSASAGRSSAFDGMQA